MNRHGYGKVLDQLAALRATQWPQLQRWSWPGALGVALIACATAVAALATPALEREVVTRHDEAHQARLQAQRLSQRTTEPNRQLASADAFRSSFPPPSMRAGRVAALLAAAEQSGLSVRRAEFRYRVILPAEGDYAAVRGFISRSLNRDAALALDGLRLTRSEDAAGGLRAELRFTLYQQIDAGDGKQR